MKYKPTIRTAILDAARKSGIQNANQFKELCKTLGISGSMGRYYYIGKHSMSDRKADLLLNHFGLKIKP